MLPDLGKALGFRKDMAANLQSPTHDPATIVFVIYALGVAGAEVMLLELVKGLDRGRFRPVIVSLAPRAALSDAFEAEGAEIHHLDMRHIEEAPLIIFRAWRLVRRLKPALLHGVMFYGDLTARILRMFHSTPHVVTALHTTSIGPRRFERVMGWSDRYTDAVTAVSNAVARAQVEAGSVSASKVTVIHNGIDISRFASPNETEATRLQAQLGLTQSDRVLLCVGRLEPVKNHTLLLRAFEHLASEFREWKLLLVGRGRLESQLRKLAASLGLEDRVHFTGELSPVAPAFQIADAFVLSSNREGLPIVVLEAMAARLPMVLTSVGGIPEIVEHGVTGLLVPPRDEQALAAALRSLFLMSDDQRQAMAAAGRRRVEERFSAQRMVAATEALYEQVLAPRRLRV